MLVVFVDECGYVKNWRNPKHIQQQPVHVAAAVAIDSSEVEDVYTSIRKDISSLNLPHTNAAALGKGEEIKAASVDRGEGFWGKNETLRDRARQIYLNHSQNITYILVCVDKAGHKNRYFTPDDPADLAFRLLLERIQGLANEREQKALVLIDANKREEAKQRNLLSWLQLRGSSGFGISRFYGTLFKWKIEMSNILEIHFGDSKYSLGLQVADFLARHAYSWWKSGKDSNHPGWNYIERRLWRYPEHDGWGYKKFP